MEKTRLFQTLKTSGVWLSGALFFLYVGSEVMLGTWTFSLLTEARGVAPELAGLFAGSYWFSFTVGRVLAGLVTRKIRIDRLVFGSLMCSGGRRGPLSIDLQPLGELDGSRVDWLCFRANIPGVRYWNSSTCRSETP